MRITEGLRKAAKEHDGAVVINTTNFKFICGQIDVIHERLERENQRILDEGVAMHELADALKEMNGPWQTLRNHHDALTFSRDHWRRQAELYLSMLRDVRKELIEFHVGEYEADAVEVLSADLKSALDELDALRGYVEELEGDNEHLRDALSVQYVRLVELVRGGQS